MSLELRNHVTTADADDGVALLDEISGQYWQLNGSGAQVLRLMLDGATQQDAVDLLTSRYRVTRERADEDVTLLIASLQEAGLAQ
ncbi:lasso peptide biosynthesis PqqD family chaperone [Saccharopolyspora gloriosae]|uniref:lasso peptide biosynthesis PqqD family chaperone n=1 Tax=Saccharopolyspora gloriosae TaxID=455344 RepID=UPI001FB61870|nr:lasso peptide biosynthesis PqqD family chaperone [Saccharopolyspora gloriosae]